jgi:transcription elongation factor/antiterminator RfaH
MDQASLPREGSRWYVVQTRPRSESIALCHLARQQFVTFCPRIQRNQRLGRHQVQQLQPYFPGYVFVELDLARDRWRSINGTIGVVRLVAFGEASVASPVPLPTGFVEQLQRLSGEAGEVRFAEHLKPGQAVRVVGGPFDQLCGRLSSVSGLERVTVLLEVLSRQTRVSVRRDMLVAA